MNRLLNAWAWSSTVLTVVVLFPFYMIVWLGTAPFDPGRYAAGRVFRLIAVAAVRLNPLWKFSVSGAPPANPRRPYVVVSNHESYADVFLISMFPWEMKWMSKTTIFRIPFMGWMMHLSGDIPLVRGERRSAVLALQACRDRLAKRVSVMMFPEGTRSKTRDLLPFKDGAFRLAIEGGFPILPIAVAGTASAMAKGSFLFRHAVAKARVMAPIETGGLTLADLPTLRDQTRELIDAARHDIERELHLDSGRFADAIGA